MLLTPVDNEGVILYPSGDRTGIYRLGIDR